MEEVTATASRDCDGHGDELVEVEETEMTGDDGLACPLEDSAAWRLFRCLHCEEVFEEEAAYLDHQHPQDEPIVPVKTVAQLDGLLVSKGRICCSLCGRRFLDARGFSAHMRKHRNEHSKESLTLEPNEHSKESLTLEPNEHSKESLTLEPSSEVTKQHIYQCPDCDRSYSVIGHLRNHQRSHKEASKSVLNQLAHLKQKSFQCHTCGRSYSRASALDAHRRCHDYKLVKKPRRDMGVGERPPTDDPVVQGEDKVKLEQTDNTQRHFECSCGKAFSSQMGLSTHQRFSRKEECSPPEIKPKVPLVKREPKSEFHCSECEKSFSGRAALVSHQRSHKNRTYNAGKKFPCEECGKVFVSPTYYYKHQRLVHSKVTAAKSFLHQVCQLQKKAFECENCGLRFSRASALQSHQLSHMHTCDLFTETEKLSTKPTSSLPHHDRISFNKRETELRVSSQDKMHAPVTETDESDGNTDDNETGDFNVEVISISSSGGSVEDDETIPDLNPDLELLCESDQEGKEGMESDVYQTVSSSPRILQSKPDIDLKIVEVDFDPFQDRLGDEMEVGDEISPLGDQQKAGKHIQPLAVKTYTCDICGHETSYQATHYNHVRKHKDRKPYKNVLYQLAGLEKNSFKCQECGKCFSRLSALHSHQQHHPKTKPHQCPDCKMSYSRASGLHSHRKSCPAKQNPQVDISDSKKEGFNPKKTLLGPKVYHCEQCGKGFWSLGAYAHHRQNQMQCADSKGKIASTASLHPVYGRRRVKVACPVCGRKFRHRGIMKSHMRIHENGNHKCELCGRLFRLFSSLLRHQVVHSAQLPPPIKCFQHEVEQVKKNTYCCPDCEKRFSRAKALQFHMKSHGYETGYSPFSSPMSALEREELWCSTCHAHFSTKSSMQSHQKLCRKNAVNQTYPDDTTPSVSSTKSATKDKTVKCPGCLSLFNSLLSLQYHRKQCSKRRATAGQNKSVDENNEQLGSKEKKAADETKSQKVEKLTPSRASDLKYKCRECERSFAVVGALNFHKRIHLQGHTSKGKRKLQTHAVHKKLKQVELAKGQFFCTECGRRFVSNAALGTHRRWHTDKKFAGSLIKDEMTHSVRHKSLDEGPFHCNKCGKGFFYLCVLRRHQLHYPPCQTKGEPEREADASVESSKASHTEFACPECNITFVRGSLLAIHYESKHSKSSEPVDPQQDLAQSKFDCKVSGEPAATPTESEGIPLKKPEGSIKAHQCAQCNQSFVKIRGLRAHTWQAHSKRAMNNGKGLFAVPERNKIAKEDETKTARANTVRICTQTVAKKKRTMGKRRKRGGSGTKSIQCLDCGKLYSSPGALYNHKKVCLVLKQEINPVKTVAEEHLSPPPSCLPESTAKCLFKCDNCGKAFPTEEQLGVHKDLAKSRPYCCALCCRGYWTETQLQQHLTWHDEVRRRLPTELRYKLSATMTSGPAQLNFPVHGPAQLNFPVHDKKANASLKQSIAPNPIPQLQNSHKCQHCGKAFLSPAALKNHEAQHTSNDSYRCSLCPRTFSEIRDLIDHHQECMGGAD